MPRRKVTVKREILPDPCFNDRLVAKFINSVMKKGKKSTAESLCYDSLELIKKKTGNDPLKVFKTAIDNIKPQVEVKSRRVGGASYQVPVDVRPSRRISLALRWLILYTRQRAGKSFEEKLAAEILDASNNTGGAVKKKEDTHKMAEANKAFAHFRW
ncbi:MAG: 30S ribosomal protein S7 [Nitrospirae bacterium]|nr:30S ribosomal protein S7 [Nitrospirota bacterium]MBI3606290.1 30S ribosomal protein S7 [Nitrospirota bacterium]